MTPRKRRDRNGQYYCTTVLLSVLLLRAPAPEQLRPRPPQTTKDQRGGPPAIIIAWPELFGGGFYNQETTLSSEFNIRVLFLTTRGAQSVHSGANRAFCCNQRIPAHGQLRPLSPHALAFNNHLKELTASAATKTATRGTCLN